MNKRQLFLYFAACILFFFLFFMAAPASEAFHRLTSVRDLISTSAQQEAATHAIRFTTNVAIPASGEVRIVPQAEYFTIPAAFDYTDVDFAVSTTGPSGFIDRALASSASATEDGVSVATGTSGSVTITLNSTDGIGAGDWIEIELGTNATFGEAGDQVILNPPYVGGFKISVTAKDDTGEEIDTSNAMIAVVEPVTVMTDAIATPPIRSNGFPTSTIAAGNDAVEISLNTNELATCRYATTTGIAYNNMTGTITTNSTTIHTEVLTGFEDNTTYTFYVRCQDRTDIPNTDDFTISFTLKDTPEPTGGGGGGGSGPVIRGSQTLFRSSVTLVGWSFQGSEVTVLQDGELYKKIPAGGDGGFGETIASLDRGTYTFALHAKDRQGRQSPPYSATMSLGQGTDNRIDNIIIPPTIELENDSSESGEAVVVRGEGVPGTVLELSVREQLVGGRFGAVRLFRATTTQGITNTPDGEWEITLDTAGFSEGTYEVGGRIIKDGTIASNASRVLFFGVGGEPEPDFSVRTDINGDKAVNLVDFSILLVHWGGFDAAADINADGVVGLADFSILLFNWTG